MKAPPTILLIWQAISPLVVLWDAFYCFLRPRSMVGGDLHWYWTPYARYQDIDFVYGIKALEEKNGFTSGQAALNVIECFLYLLGLVLYKKRKLELSYLITYTAAVMTLSKTALYWITEYFSEFTNIGHNDLNTILLMWALPNGLWIIFPTLLTYFYGMEIYKAVRNPAAKPKKQA